MAFRTLSKRLFNPTTLKISLIPPQPPNLRHDTGYSRRFLAINNHSSTEPFPTFLTLPIGEKLRDKIKNVAGDHRLCHPTPSEVDDGLFSMHASDLKRVMRFVQLEKVRNRLRNIPANTVLYSEFLRVCEEVCGSREIGLEFAKVLDECGNVIVLGGVVFLRPDQVVKSMEKLISQTISMPNDPRKKELENQETIKALIDKKAQSQVRGELYCGLVFLLVQTLGFMRLTFWELSWDVMEPICFFVTSFHFALAYTFFLKTSNEPTFEGYFRRRFYTKQKKLMKILKFDVERYNQLHEAFYPGHSKLELNKIVP